MLNFWHRPYIRLRDSVSLVKLVYAVIESATQPAVTKRR
jgi:hypothetical protein